MKVDLPSEDALAFAICELYKKRNDGLEFITKRNEAMCKEVADFLAAILEKAQSEHGKGGK